MTTQVPHIKFLTVGDSYIGKSIFSNVFLYNSIYSPYHPNMGYDYLISRDLKIDDITIKIMSWVITRRYARDQTLLRIYYRNTNGILLMYDITNRESFYNIRDVWYQKVYDCTDDSTQCILIGNKCDLESERKVESSKAREFADSLKIPFIETSAKDNINVEFAFMTLAAMVVRNSPNEVLESTTNCQLGRDIVVNHNSACYC